MKIGLLTSSRADFGIYLPLAKVLEKDPYFDLEIIAFGTHLSENHGKTISEIQQNGFKIIHEIETLPKSDSALHISEAIGETVKSFSAFWEENKFDLVFCLGDRYEMFAAVSAGTPFNVKFAHLHGGETTLGAIDNGYRHALSLFSNMVFVSTEEYKKRAEEIVESSVGVYNVGALSVDNLSQVNFLTKTQFKERFNIDLNIPTLLSTFHPETVALSKNKNYIEELIGAFSVLEKDFQILITLPNTDTMGQMIREYLLAYGKNNPKVKIVESLGMLGYLSAIKHCEMLVGNTSSGFVEATYFPKYVVNLGNRQTGRIITENIKTIDIFKSKIVDTVYELNSKPNLQDLNVYGNGNTASRIVNVLKNI
jgi:GDP/UDP-N,N'-diacetylbacillosamine 2-epimerase (hydrolysing)